MAIVKIDLSELIELKKSLPVLDARSLAEYNHAHICGAHALPIFDNEERRIIGTAYKQESREKAIRLGLAFFGKKLLTLVDKAENIIKVNGNASREIIIHCWRGGMRSATMAWLLDLYGFKVFLLNGGYKQYRHWVLEQFEKKYPLHIISGCTGSNKTGLLHELKRQNHSVIDLEGLAKHKGSTFGNLNEYPQPTQEQFENELAEQLFSVNQNKPNCIWVEGESQRIGQVNVPSAFYKKMLQNPTIKLEIPFEERLIHIMQEYGSYEVDKIEGAIIRITKKLGGLETKTAIEYLKAGDLKNCYAIILKYYDRLYRKSTFTSVDEKHCQILNSNTTAASINLQLLLSI
jgi:tRNA 2-selenouridine synthase